MKQKNKLMVVGGGTGGHVFPGLVIAHYLIKQGWEVQWLGTSNHIEAILVPKHNIYINFIKINSLRGKKIKEQLIVFKELYSSIIHARHIMMSWQPNVVLCMGGYVSGPGGLAAWSCGIPLILHEQNSIVGLTNCILSKFAFRVLQAFPNTFYNGILVGNPLRDIILNIPIPNDRFRNRYGPLRVLVMGGSQGAHLFNKIMPFIAARLSGTLIIWHQVGENAYNKVRMTYLSVQENQHKIVEFIDDIDIAYTWADIVICRSGALTVSEIIAVGLPSLLVPFIYHKDKQQYLNALPLERVGAAIIIEQSKFTIDYICTILTRLNRNKLLQMANNAKMIAILDATQRVSQEIIVTQKEYNTYSMNNKINFLKKL